MAEDRTDVTEGLLRQVHYEIAAGHRRAQQAASFHPESEIYVERVRIWESLDEECEELRARAGSPRRVA
ncbi:MAG: hypothetical protein IT198_07480 [Acidimicrobiia bacterium]|nr:hypothetical protein [Acidimicrobiia bacterium]